MMRVLNLAVLLVTALLSPNTFAWGDRGHEVTALIAWQFMTPTAREKVSQLLATDDSGLTGPDIAAQSTWADEYRDSDRNTTKLRYQQTYRWHFVNLDLQHPDLDSACFNFPPLEGPASTGPDKTCIVDKIEQFENELGDANTDAHERLRALQFLLHLIGDLHQPLHASNNNDNGGSRATVIIGANKRMSLHGYWDGEVIRRLGRDTESIVANLTMPISAQELARWQRGNARDWATEAWRIARGDIYRRLPEPLPDGSYRLDNNYQNRAKEIARLQLQRAGVRLAFVLNRIFDPSLKGAHAPR